MPANANAEATARLRAAKEDARRAWDAYVAGGGSDPLLREAYLLALHEVERARWALVAPERSDDGATRHAAWS